VAVLLYIVMQQAFLLYVVVLLGITALGLIISESAERIYGRKDPSNVVIDEVAGMLLACFLLPIKPWVLIWTFIILRFFDITKVYPINRMEKLKGSIGIMMDDIIAGLYTNVIMHIAIALRIII